MSGWLTNFESFEQQTNNQINQRCRHSQKPQRLDLSAEKWISRCRDVYFWRLVIPKTPERFVMLWSLLSVSWVYQRKIVLKRMPCKKNMLMMMLQDFPIVPNFWRSFHPIIHKFVIIFPLADLQFYGVSWSTVNGIHTRIHTHTLIHIQRHIHPTYTHIHTIHYMIHIDMNMRIDMHIHYPYTFIHTHTCIYI